MFVNLVEGDEAIVESPTGAFGTLRCALRGDVHHPRVRWPLLHFSTQDDQQTAGHLKAYVRRALPGEQNDAK